MADRTVCEINFLLAPLIYLTGTFTVVKRYKSIIPPHACNDMLFSIYLIWPEVNPDWPDIKSTINHSSERPSVS